MACEMIEDGLYDLIIMDLRMPVLDGFRAAKILVSEKGVRTPIIGFLQKIQEKYKRCVWMLAWQVSFQSLQVRIRFEIS